MKKRKFGIKQHDITDCGAACLASVAAHFGLQMPISKIRQYASTDKKGTNILGMIEAAEKLGLSAKGVKGEFESLFKIPTPTIAHVVVKEVLHHFVVIYNTTDKYIEVMDPMDGKLHKIPHEEFKEQWTGVLVLITPSGNFEKGNEKVSITSRLWFLLKPHWTVLLQALIGAAVFTIVGLSTAIFVQLIVDYVLVDGNRNLLNLLGIGMILLLLLQIFIGVAKTVFVLKTGQLIDARLILGYYKHLLKLPQRFFDTMRVGEIISRINDAVKIRAFINDVAINIIVNIFIVLFSFGLMFTYFWKLGLIMLAIIPVYALVYFITNQINKRTQRKLMEDAADLESQLVESLNSVSTIKQFGLEDFANMKTETRFVQLLKTVYRSGLNSVFSGNASQFTSKIFTIILLWVGAGFVLQGDITPGELLSFYAIIGYFTGPVSELVGMNKTIQDAMIAADRLFEIMDLDKEEQGQNVALKPEMIGDIRFSDVHFRYGSRVDVFKDLNLVIPKGKVTAFVGESGSGKTTLVNILQRMYPIESGRVTIGDINLAHIDTRSLRDMISVVPQKIDLFSGNVIDNIAVGAFDPDMEKILHICKTLGILSFIEDLPNGFETHLGENGAALSGGQKQRIAIARALYKDPEILILDEATSSLDSASEQYVQDAVSYLRDEGKTVILIAHRFSTVFMADKISVLEKGKLVEEGAHKELLSNKSHYYRLWQNQFPFLNGELNSAKLQPQS
ncbi:peptidase domain-containing ABC transporter [Rhodohalobacter sulfatireducens]|uniref:Peptidase domain-containing ABC transporter n=1 Tax=Rhodohalobacter sulfatireducens TaxID=2911366 RepID=A0ABS9KC07_9BACT|nr:peptidase domain-containing ABC transporter [Rhodohalobacter sulfatireducens]MCG2588367.1 peptidase domain-containing ABC transporter [Rhodohalobacter sulfatireducens]